MKGLIPIYKVINNKHAILNNRNIAVKSKLDLENRIRWNKRLKFNNKNGFYPLGENNSSIIDPDILAYNAYNKEINPKEQSFTESNFYRRLMNALKWICGVGGVGGIAATGFACASQQPAVIEKIEQQQEEKIPEEKEVIEKNPTETQNNIETIVETPTNLFDNLDKVFRYKQEEDMWPEGYLNSPEKVVIEDLAPEEIERSRKIVYSALKKYPEEVLNTIRLERVYVLKSIKIKDHPSGGLNTENSVLVTNAGKENGYTDLLIEQIIHSEISSKIIVCQEYVNLFDIFEFEALNLPGFEYYSLEEYEKLYKEGKISTALDPELYEKGFLYSYAMVDSMQDYNSHVESLFKNDGEYWELTEQYPILKNKRDYVVNFLNQVNPLFTLEYFEEISQK